MKITKSKISRMSHQEKAKTLLVYAKQCYKYGYKPTKRSIRKNFNLEIYNYFENIAAYHKEAGIPVALRFYPRKKAKSVIKDFVRNEAKAYRYPEFREIEKKFKIKFCTYFHDLKELYSLAGIDYSLVEKARSESRFSSKAVLEEQKHMIKEFIHSNVRNGFYPSVVSIQKKLNLSFYNLYTDIHEAYKDAGVNYNRPSPILLGREKERILTNIVKELLPYMGYSIERISIESEKNFNRHADMTVKDGSGNLYLLEIKAYRDDYHISNRELLQLAAYLEKEGISNGIFVTTSTSIKCNFPNIWFINGNYLKKLLAKYDLLYNLSSVNWIQKERVNSEKRIEYLKVRKQQIMDYIKNVGYIPTKKELQRNLNIDLRSIFGRSSRPYEKMLEEVKRLRPLTPTI